MSSLSEITKELAHVVHEGNLFVHRVARDRADNTFVADFDIDGKHPYLYENAAIANHVSGTTFLEVARQLLKAIGHLYYDVPPTNRFALREMHTEFPRWARIAVPICAQVEVNAESTHPGGSRSSFDVRITFLQEGAPVCRAAGKFLTFSRKLEDRLMARTLGQAVRP